MPETKERSLVNDLIDSGEEMAWDWSKLPQQESFLTSLSPFTMFSGGFASGKTSALCAKTILLLMSVPGNLGYLGRLDGKALRSSTMQSLYEMLPKQYMAKHNDQRGFLQLRPEYGGGRLVYGDFKDLNDLKNIPLGFFAIDQAEEVPKAVWDYLVGRLRRRTPVLHEGKRQYWVLGECSQAARHFALHRDTKCRLCSKSLPRFDETRPTVDTLPPWDMVCYKNYGFGACNPEGPSHWIFQYFPGLPGKHGPSGPGKEGYESFHATAWDGLKAGFVREDYLRQMENQYRPIPVMWDRYLEGKWIEAEGLVYPSWDRAQSVIHRHALKHDGTPLYTEDDEVYEYIDHGLTAPTAVGWVVIKPCDCGCEKLNYFVIDEHYEGEKPVSYHSTCIKLHRERIPCSLRGTYLDSQAFSRTLLGQKGTPREDSIYSVADEYMDHGIHCNPNQKDWDAGYNRINELLFVDPNHVHPVTGKQGAPHIFVLSHNTHFIGEVETYKWKKTRNAVDSNFIREEPADGNDHHMDGLNGLLTSRPVEYTPATEEDTEPAWLIQMNREIGGSASHMGL